MEQIRVGISVTSKVCMLLYTFKIFVPKYKMKSCLTKPIQRVQYLLVVAT